jgi:hypothetical protein
MYIDENKYENMSTKDFKNCIIEINYTCLRCGICTDKM